MQLDNSVFPADHAAQVPISTAIGPYGGAGGSMGFYRILQRNFGDLWGNTGDFERSPANSLCILKEALRTLEQTADEAEGV